MSSFVNFQRKHFKTPKKLEIAVVRFEAQNNFRQYLSCIQSFTQKIFSVIVVVLGGFLRKRYKTLDLRKNTKKWLILMFKTLLDRI